jgi:hypothetical protein
MSDGAHMGVKATRALGTILGGDDQPSEEERQSPQEVLARVLAAPLPGEGPPPYERDGAAEEAYGMVADSIARCFLVLEGDDPGLLDRPETAAWDALTDRWPDADEWFRGATGFQVGFAFNTARYVTGRGPVGNPALVDVEVDDGDA